MKRFKLLSVLILATISIALFVGDDKNKLRKISTNDDYKFIAANNCKMWFSNNGDGSHDPIAGGNGFYYPYLTNPQQALIFEDGLIFGGKIGNDIRFNGNTHRQGLQAGKILAEGIADDPSLEKYRIYRIRKDWKNYPNAVMKSQLEKDWNEWPVEDGAPWIDIDGDGIFTRGTDEPQCIGDETLWYVSNDLDPIRSTFTYGTLPMGLEFQTTVFAFSNPYAPINDVIFKKYKVINKGKNTIKDFYFGYWTDDDMGDAGDDLVGCDTMLSMFYTYNGDNYDQIYNDGAPPAVAHAVLQGPIVNSFSSDSALFDGKWIKGKKNLPMTSCISLLKWIPLYRDARQGDPLGALEFYNYLKGLTLVGDVIINPISGMQTTYCVPGDPITGTGWYDYLGWPGLQPPPADRRAMMGIGPINFAPSDTQEVIIAIIVARGKDRLNSIKRLRESVTYAKKYYDNLFQIDYNIPSANLNSRVGEREVNLFWSSEAENFLIPDQYLPDSLSYSSSLGDTIFKTPDKFFRFEGYQLFQYKDEKGAEPILLQQWDLQNNIANVFHWQDKLTNNPIALSNPIIKLSDSGIVRKFTIEKDKYTGQYLVPAKKYYFALRTIAYSEYSSPPIQFSSPKIYSITPGKPAIDISPYFSVEEEINAVQTVGNADAAFQAIAYAPELMKDRNYKVVFTSVNNAISYNLINEENGDTLFKHLIYESQSDAQIIDGFYTKIINIGYDSIKTRSSNNYVRAVEEINGKDGVTLTPKNVLNEFNTTSKWKIIPTVTYSNNPFQNINWQYSLGNYDYEVRFTNRGSQYYYSKSNGLNPHLKSDNIAPDRLPFEVWRIDALGNQKQSFVKIVDVNNNTRWNYDAINSQWEAIMVYFKDETDVYTEPLSLTSNTSLNFQHRLKFAFVGELPEEGTVIKFSSWKPIKVGNEFSFSTHAPKKNDSQSAKERLSQINVFPNPYFGRETFDDKNEFVTFTNLPATVTIRIFSLGGTFIKRLDKDNGDQYLVWDLKNSDGYFVGSGIYLAHLEMPGIGQKIMKIAIIQENRFYLGY